MPVIFWILTGLSDFRLQTGSSGINAIANIDWTISPYTTSDNSDDSTSESQNKFRANKTRQQIAHGVPIIPPSLSIFTRTSSPNGIRQIRIVTAAKRPACITASKRPVHYVVKNAVFLEWYSSRKCIIYGKATPRHTHTQIDHTNTHERFDCI